MRQLTRDFYPAHLVPSNWFFHHWRGENQIGRIVRCLACDVVSETRNRNGDARFIRAHRRCGMAGKVQKCKRGQSIGRTRGTTRGRRQR